MAPNRRHFLHAAACTGLAGLLPQQVYAQASVDMAQVLSASALPIHAIGAADAKITVVEYASLTCSHCASFHADTLPALKEKYIDTGKVRLIFRHFALNVLDAAASMLALSLAEDKYFPAIATFFKTQEQWAFAQQGEPRENLFNIARQMGFSREKFEEVLKDQGLFEKLSKERDAASQKFKIESTPTFIINGLVMPGAHSITDLDKVFEPMLKM